MKGTAQGVADWFTGKSVSEAKRAEENEAKTKLRLQPQHKGYSEINTRLSENWR